MTLPKIPKAGQSVMPLHTHTVRSKGKFYSYRKKKFVIWLSEDEIKLLEACYNYMKSTRHPDFTDKERSSPPKFIKAVIIKYSQMVQREFIDVGKND